MKLKQVFLLFALFAGVSGSPALSAEPVCEDKTLVVLGDSLVAGYGLGPNEGFPEQFAAALRQQDYDLNIINAGVSGDTSAGGLARLDWSVPEKTNAVIVELGANDALRGISPEITYSNLGEIISRLKARNIKVLIAGMLAPPNMGEAYGEKFNGMYERLSTQHDTLLYPFFLEGVAGNPELNQDDGIHPTAEGIALIVEKFMASGLELVKRACGD